MTKDEEKKYFNDFITHFAGCDYHEFFFSESPDVQLKLKNGQTIGIELTECIYNENLKKEDETQKKFNEKVRIAFEKKLKFKFFSYTEVDKSKKIINKNKVIETLVKKCCQELSNLKPNEYKLFYNIELDLESLNAEVKLVLINKGFRNLPSSIESIYLQRFDDISSSNCYNSVGGLVPNFTYENLRLILNKKERTLKAYHSFDFQYLVLIEGVDFSSYFNEIVIPNKFETTYDKVFIYRAAHKKIITLK